MAKKNQHVVPLGNGWAVKSEGSSRVTVIITTQSDAIEAAKSIAKNNETELIIHGRNGQIRERNNYGNDPNPPKG
ncbi:MAG TPA: DUF2188 domain-containing protein [Chitinophagaceae bacterium]|nr:DUF2188 domain-containing protein [Chitinophagaceae bacterium]